MSADPLLPVVDAVAAPFFEAARRGELVVQQCPETGRLLFPPRTRSPWAPRAAPHWVPVSGRGTIWSFAVPHPPLLPYFAERAPYAVVLVALDDDPRVRLAGCLVAGSGAASSPADPATVEIGASVRVVFERLTEDITLPQWCLAGPSATRTGR